MRKVIAVLALLALGVLPAVAGAKPDRADKRAAKHECKAERGKSNATHEAFRARYGSFRDCVRKRAADEEGEHESAARNAAKECKAEREDPSFADDHDGKTFEEFYGTNANLKNAFGKCVSGKAKALEDEMDAKDEDEAEQRKDAAKRCAAERGEMGADAFAAEYGDKAKGRNAFGKCVSAKVMEPDE